MSGVVGGGRESNGHLLSPDVSEASCQVFSVIHKGRGRGVRRERAWGGGEQGVCHSYKTCPPSNTNQVQRTDREHKLGLSKVNQAAHSSSNHSGMVTRHL